MWEPFLAIAVIKGHVPETFSPSRKGAMDADLNASRKMRRPGAHGPHEWIEATPRFCHEHMSEYELPRKNKQKKWHVNG